jgi:nucleotide-binding universal stress UspA family protein
VTDRRIRRVVVALDDGAVEVLREAVAVAKRLDAALEGLFVEDEQQLHASGLAFVRRHRQSAPPEPFAPSELEREWRSLAAAARQALQEEARRGTLEAAFAIERTVPEEAVSRRLAAGDLVLVGWGSRPRRVPTGPTAQLLWDGSEEAARAFGVALRLTQRLVVWQVQGADGPLAELIRAAPEDVMITLRVLEETSPMGLRHRVEEEGGGLLLLPAQHPITRGIARKGMALRMPAAVLVIG